MAKTEPTEAAAAKPESSGKRPAKKTFKKRGEKRIIHHGIAHIHASFNNTTITLTDTEGNVVSWSSAGGIGFKGSRKGTPFAATQAAISAGNAAKTFGMRTVEVRVKGPGAGRESAIRALQTVGIEVKSNPGCDPHPAQWVPAAEAETGVGKREQPARGCRGSQSLGRPTAGAGACRVPAGGG